MDRALAGHAAPFAAYWTGPHRFADEFWVLSHHEVAVHDLLPMYDTNGRPITYFWGNTKVPYPGKWAREPAKFPRAWLTAGAFLDGGGYLKGLRCSQPSLRLLQYEAACGRATLQRPAARGLHCAWLGLAVATFRARDGAREVREFLLDIGNRTRKGCGLPAAAVL